MINYDPGVQVMADRSSSVLLLHEAEKIHEGNYTCKPSNAVPASINVHVLNATEGEIDFRNEVARECLNFFRGPFLFIFAFLYLFLD